MQWVTDRTGRFAKRPHYDPIELDQECERIVYDFLIRKYGKFEFPITTSDLTILIENCVEDLDQGADLTEEHGEVEGLTEFIRGNKPTVRISSTLIGNPIMENRLRTTLTHEFSHVTFHTFMFEVEVKPRSLFESTSESPTQLTHKCKRDNMLESSATDWMEWQAGYGCGAFLMPITSLACAVKEFRQEHNIPVCALSLCSQEGQNLIQAIASGFQTSKDAARVRLLQKRFLHNDGGNRATSLFD